MSNPRKEIAAQLRKRLQEVRDPCVHNFPLHCIRLYEEGDWTLEYFYDHFPEFLKDIQNNVNRV